VSRLNHNAIHHLVASVSSNGSLSIRSPSSDHHKSVRCNRALHRIVRQNNLPFGPSHIVSHQLVRSFRFFNRFSLFLQEIESFRKQSLQVSDCLLVDKSCPAAYSLLVSSILLVSLAFPIVPPRRSLVLINACPWGDSL
jgi:hypothetical protein